LIDSSQIQPVQKLEPLIPLSTIASLFGFSPETVQEMLDRRSAPIRQEFFSIPELAARWRCSRGTVYNRLRSVGAKVLDFAAPGRRGRKAIPASVVMQIENRHTKRLA
jgi:hypothetical protein